MSQLTLTSLHLSLSPSHFFTSIMYLNLPCLSLLSIPPGCVHCLSVAWLDSLMSLCLCANVPPVSSPSLSLAQSSQPYFLHPALPSSRPGFCNSQPLVDPRSQRHVGLDKRGDKDWGCGAGSDHEDDSLFGFRDSPVDFGAGFSRYHGDIFTENTHSANNLISDSKTNKGDFVSESFCNFDSSDSAKRDSTLTEPVGPGCTTPYKNIDVMMMYSKGGGAVGSLYSDQNPTRARTYKELPPLPAYYLYSPKNCPLHQGAPPRLSPIGALSPPRRSGAMGSRLHSPLSPRSHTLPALAAPLYYPYLYPPIPPRPPSLSPKLYQGHPQSRVASKISLFFLFLLHFTSLSRCLSVTVALCLSLLFILKGVYNPNPRNFGNVAVHKNRQQ